MIGLITGKIGAGKTLFALAHIILGALLRGECVCTNIALLGPVVEQYLRRRKRKFRLRDRQLRFISFEEHPDFHWHIPIGIPGCPVHVIIDEAHLYYNSANRNEMNRRLLELISFLTQSRKCCVDVWFITQHKSLLWNQFREQVEFGYKCRDMRSAELPIFGKMPVLGLRWVKYDVASDEVLVHGRTPLSRRLFGLYNTFQMYDSQMTELMAKAERWIPEGKTDTRPQ